MQRLGVFAVMCLALGCSSGTGGSGTATPNASGGSEGFTGQLTLLDDSRNQVDISSAHPDEQAALTELAQAAVADANLNPEMRTVALLIQTTEGTSLKSFQGFTKLQHIDFAGPGINDEVMAGLKDCTGLEIVQLQKTSVTDAGLAHLAGASGLKVLQVHDAPITGAGLALVPQVKSLILGRRTKVQGDGFAPMEGMQCTVARFIEFDDAALKHVAKMPKLEVLEFPNTAVTDEGVVALKGHPSLSRLALDGVKLGGAGLAALAEAPNLSYLSASGTPITDADLAQIKGSKSLTALLINSTKITDKGLAELEGMTTLKELRIEHTDVTPEGVAKLRQALPGCNISTAAPAAGGGGGGAPPPGAGAPGGGGRPGGGGPGGRPGGRPGGGPGGGAQPGGSNQPT